MSSVISAGGGSEPQSTRDKLLELNLARQALEEEVDALTQELQTNGVGVKGKLVDEEGFPKADVDIYSVTHKRARLATLNYDHRALMKEIETLLPIFYAEQAAANPSSESSINEKISNSNSNSQSQTSNNKNGNSEEEGGKSAPLSSVFMNFTPIAILDEILPGSPASLAGIQEGDYLLKFADITQQSFEPLKRIAENVGNSLNVPIDLVINRKGDIIALILTPKVWAGRGTLGCHLSLLKR